MTNPTPGARAGMSHLTTFVIRDQLSLIITETKNMETKAGQLRDQLANLDAGIAQRRAALEELRILLILAEGDTAIHPNMPPEALTERAEVLRSVYAAAGGLAHRFDEAAKTRRDVPVAGSAPYPAETAPMAAAETPAVVQAKNLSCQGLQMIDPDHPLHGGVPVEGYHEEMKRRGEDHVYGCELIGHGAQQAGADPGLPIGSIATCPGCRQPIAWDGLGWTHATVTDCTADLSTVSRPQDGARS